MDKRMLRLSPAPMTNDENHTEFKVDMENEVTGTRWAIPRPSLTCSMSSIESSNRPSRVLPPSKSRGSASSQGSTSNHSTHSASSGSLLLSAANLSKMNTLHSPSKKGEPIKPNNYQNNLSVYVHSTNAPSLADDEKLTTPEQMDSLGHSDPFWKNVKLASAKSQRIDTRDTESVASSTHFTVVNGFTRHTRSNKNESQMWCCKSSHQITVLVITMTILFTAGILAAICYVEMRQRRDIGSRFS